MFGPCIHVQGREMEKKIPWFDTQDLHVDEILPQMITLSTSYIQVRNVRAAPVSKGHPCSVRRSLRACGPVYVPLPRVAPLQSTLNRGSLLLHAGVGAAAGHA